MDKVPNREISPLVSVIVITYNSAEFVLQTLESINNQKYKNLELIISDDSSTDNTIEICENWVSLNSKFFTNCEIVNFMINTGIPANCSRGVAAANGKWIKLIAGDDLLMPNCISDNINFIIKSHF